MKYAGRIFAIIYVTLSFSFAATIVKTKANSSDSDPEIPYNHTLGKHNPVANCTRITLRYGEYQLSNGTLHVQPYGLKLNKSSFVLFNNSVTICRPNFIDELYCDGGYTFRITENILCMAALLMSLLYAAMLYDVRNLVHGTYVILGTSLMMLVMYIIFVIYNGTSDCSDNVLRFPAMNHFFLLAFFFWLSSIALDGTKLQQPDEIFEPWHWGTIIDLKITMRNIFIRVFLMFFIAVLWDCLVSTPVIKFQFTDPCLQSIKLLFLSFLRPIVTFSVILCLESLLTHHFVWGRMSVDRSLPIVKTFNDTHLLLFLFMTSTWFMASASVVYWFTGQKEFMYLLLCLEFLQICGFFLVVPLSEVVDNHLIKTVSK